MTISRAALLATLVVSATVLAAPSTGTSAAAHATQRVPVHAPTPAGSTLRDFGYYYGMEPKDHLPLTSPHSTCAFTTDVSAGDAVHAPPV